MQMSDDCENVELEPEDLPLIELPPLVAGEHRLGIQVSVAGAVKGKLDESAASLLRARGEGFLEEIVLEAKSITMLDQPKLLDPKVRSEDITRAFDRVVNRYAERRGRTSRFWKFLHELPVLLFAVGLTKLTEGLIDLARSASDPSRTMSIAIDMTVACVAFVIALLLFFGLSQRD
jgi:hypothetical protein